MGLLGFSFGKKKQSGTQTTDLSSTTNLTGNQQQSSVQAGNTTTNTSGVTNTSGTQTGTTTQDQSQQQAGTQKTTGLTTTLGGDVIDALSKSVQSVLSGGVTPGNIAALSDMISGRTGFNADKFVADTETAARNRGEQSLQESGSAFAARAGGTSKTNSMAALLEQRGRNDLEANLAGVRAQATATAEGIENQNLATAIEAQSGIAGIGAALTQALKGGATTTDMTSLTDEISRLVGSGTTTQASQQTATASETSSTQQLLTEITNLLSQQTENKTGTETSTMKGKSGGFGLSLGI